jgi:ketosteroid isomerase-like protein
LLALLIPHAAARAQSLPPGHAAALTDSLTRFAQDAFSAIRNRDANRAIAMYDQSPRFLHGTNGTFETWAQLEPAMRAFLGAIKEANMQWVEAPRVLLVSRDVAVITGVSSFSGIDPEGRPIPARRGASTMVVQRLAEGWRIVHTHSSNPQ